MIEFNYIIDYQLVKTSLYQNWLQEVIISEGKTAGELTYIFCDDEYLLRINLEYLNHDTLTDIITFDYTSGNSLSGDIFISVERVKDNASKFKVDFEEELRRVMAHGILHLAGYGDKEENEVLKMRAKEEEKMKLFHVEQ